MPILHNDKLCSLAGTIYIGFIRDETDVAAQHRVPKIEMPSLIEMFSRLCKPYLRG